MNVFIITNSRPHLGGMTTYINTLLKVLHANNHNVRIVSSFGVYNNERKILNKSNKSLTMLLRRGNSILILFIYIASKFLLFLFFIKAYLGSRPDIVHAVDISAASVVSSFLRRKKIPLITSIHSFVVQDLVGKKFIKQDSILVKLFLNEERFACSNSTKLIASCANIEDYIKKLGYQNKIIRISNFVDVKKFYPSADLRSGLRAKLNYGKDDFVLLFIGRMITRKGPIYPAKVLKLLLDEGKLSKLIYIGNGPEENNVLKYVKKNNLEEHVKFMGPLPHSQLNEFHNLADVIIFPFFAYKEDVEPAGISPLEASASGIPMISFSSGGLKESVVDGYNGFLVEEHDIEALMEKIRFFYNDRIKLKEMAVNCRNYILRNHDQNVIYKKIISLYENVAFSGTIN